MKKFILLLLPLIILGCDSYDAIDYERRFDDLFLAHFSIVNFQPDFMSGFGNEYNGKCRIIVEDLVSDRDLCGSISGGDWDWNDLVFDVEIDSDSTTITLLAVMSKLKIYVCDREVHEVFGVMSQMVDTRKSYIYSPVSFRVETKTWDVNEIPIIIRSRSGELNLLYVEKGRAPSKICVDCDYDWCEEGEDINIKYPLFKEWITGNIDNNNNWYRYGKN